MPAPTKAVHAEESEVESGIASLALSSLLDPSIRLIKPEVGIDSRTIHDNLLEVKSSENKQNRAS